MQIEVKVLEKDKPLEIVDKLAIALDKTHNSEENATKKFEGVFSLPYNLYTGKEQESQNFHVIAFCDGKPHSFAWRWWGKRAEVIIEELKKQGLEIKNV